jgi:hypothetical protein
MHVFVTGGSGLTGPAIVAGHIGDPFLARCFATDAPVSSDRTRALLGWAPAHATLLEDMETGDYFAVQPA